MSIEVTNAPAAFMVLMNRVIQNYLEFFVIAFIDNIMVYSKNESDHVNHMEIVLKLLEEHQLFAKYSKCEFLLRLVAFLGHIISSE